MILRDDDIYLTKSPRYDIIYYDFDKFKKAHKLLKGHKHYLAIIASEIDTYPELTEYILANKKDFGFGIHGWEHSDYHRIPNIEEELKRAKDKIEETFDTDVKWFFPPWNRWGEKTEQACINLGIKLDNNYTQFPDIKKADTLCFHYWNDKKVNALAKWLQS